MGQKTLKDKRNAAISSSGAQTETDISSEKPKAEYKKHFWRRLIAFVLAALLILSCTGLVTMVQMRRKQKQTELEYAGTLLEQASNVAGENTPYLRMKLLEQAWQLVQHAIGKPKSFEDYDTYASLAITRGEYPEAADYIQGCIDTWTEDCGTEPSVLWLKKGSLYTLSDKNDEAIACYSKAIELNETSQDAYLLRAQMYSQNGEAEAAAADLRRYEELSGPNPVIQGAMGSLYESIEDYERAIKCYDLAIESGNYETANLASRARCEILSGDTLTAIDDLKRFFEEGGTDETGDYYAMYGMCLEENERYAEAVKAFRDAIKAGYKDKKTLLNESVVCSYAAEDYAAAIEDGEKYIELLSKDEGTEADIAEMEKTIGFAYFVTGEFEPASEKFKSVLEFDPDMEFINYYAGICFMSIEDYAAAAKYLTRSADMGEYVSVCRYDSALCHIQLEDYDTAMQELNAAIEAADDEEAVKEAEEMTAELEAFLEDAA